MIPLVDPTDSTENVNHSSSFSSNEINTSPQITKSKKRGKKKKKVTFDPTLLSPETSSSPDPSEVESTPEEKLLEAYDELHYLITGVPFISQSDLEPSPSSYDFSDFHYEYCTAWNQERLPLLLDNSWQAYLQVQNIAYGFDDQSQQCTQRSWRVVTRVALPAFTLLGPCAVVKVPLGYKMHFLPLCLHQNRYYLRYLRDFTQYHPSHDCVYCFSGCEPGTLIPSGFLPIQLSHWTTFLTDIGASDSRYFSIFQRANCTFVFDQVTQMPSVLTLKDLSAEEELLIDEQTNFSYYMYSETPQEGEEIIHRRLRGVVNFDDVVSFIDPEDVGSPIPRIIYSPVRRLCHPPLFSDSSFP